jgi:AbrB family looped-hinge helix DNA binding protein
MPTNNKPFKSKVVGKKGADSVIVTVPLQIRYKMNLNPGDTLEFYPLEDGKVCIRKMNDKNELTSRAQNEKIQ